ncbi:M23 family metallopeptidase [Acinetobacter cumulans]|uniref:M23 family metallopeptidase n=1 Tax=Acinetobacter cumulans TaxID=2136182 RepID=UPI0014440B3A|nr:M23 family metallopeptidase [Acinetobacter cumulans]
MKYSFASTLILSLYLTGCGGGNSASTSAQPPNQPQINEVVATLGPKVSTVSLSNIAEATFSAEDVKRNPIISIKKERDDGLVASFDWAKKILNIESGSDYEIKITSSKTLNSDVNLELSVPSELISALNEKNALAAYIVTNLDEGETERGFHPIESTYNLSSQKLAITLSNQELKFNNDSNPVSITIKIGLAESVSDELLTPLAALAKVELPNEGAGVRQTLYKPQLICPILNGTPNICTETSRFGPREPRGEGAGGYHYGIDFRANSSNSLISAFSGEVIAINKFGGAIAIRANNGEGTIVYRHMSVIDKKVGDKLLAGDVIGKAGNIGVPSEHLHFELTKNNVLPVCKVSNATERTCKTRISARIDPYIYFLEGTKISKILPVDSVVPINKKVKLELHGFDIKNNIITTAINNSSVNPNEAKGTLRTITWNVDSPLITLLPDENLKGIALTPLSDSINELLRNTATLTINEEVPTTITAYWDGVNNIEANYIIKQKESPGGFALLDYKCEKKDDKSTELSGLVSATLQPGEQITIVYNATKYKLAEGVFMSYIGNGEFAINNPNYSFGSPWVNVSGDCTPTDDLNLNPTFYAICHLPMNRSKKNIWVNFKHTVSEDYIESSSNIVLQVIRATTPNLNPGSGNNISGEVFQVITCK